MPVTTVPNNSNGNSNGSSNGNSNNSNNSHAHSAPVACFVPAEGIARQDSSPGR